MDPSDTCSGSEESAAGCQRRETFDGQTYNTLCEARFIRNRGPIRSTEQGTREEEKETAGFGFESCDGITPSVDVGQVMYHPKGLFQDENGCYDLLFPKDVDQQLVKFEVAGHVEAGHEEFDAVFECEYFRGENFIHRFFDLKS